jgi:hypothetical protein
MHSFLSSFLLSSKDLFIVSGMGKFSREQSISKKEKLGENEFGIGGFRKKKMGLAKSEVG